MKKALEELAYQNHFLLATHYSNVTHKSKIAILTFAVFAWAYILGATGTPLTTKVKLLGLEIGARVFASYSLSMVLSFFLQIEAVYYKKYFAVVKSGKKIEERYDIDGYFTQYKTPQPIPFISFYLLLFISYLLAYFLFLNPSAQNEWLISSLLISFPIAIFCYGISDFWRACKNAYY